MINNRLKMIASFLLMTLCAVTTQAQDAFNWPYKIENGTIVTEVPQRPAGQQNVLNLTTPKLKVVRVGFVGLGMRGPSAVERWTHINGTQVMALCDHEKDRAEACNEILHKAGLPAADVYYGEDGYKQLCERKDIDLVYIATDWLDHVPISVYALEHGHHVAVEVPAAMTIAECWQLVDASEKARRHCMMLENCCYDFFEMSALNMAQHGLFGEVYHVEGAYIHFLAEDWDRSETWRVDYNIDNRGDNYPTHGLGPICQALNIHRGDKMDYLVAMDTPSYNGKVAAKKFRNKDYCKDGDHTISLIQTEKDKLIEVQHNVYAYRPYSRMYQLTGTEGFANKYPQQGISVKGINGHNYVSEEVMDSLLTAYRPDFAKAIEEKAKTVGGHGGMDFIMDYRLIYCLHNGLPLDEDVYDAAEWSAVQELSRISLENGSMPVRFPDFTRGDWNVIDGFHYAL